MSENGHDLLVAALSQIEMHPETWDQENWRCETGMCLAGWMAELSTEVQWVRPRVPTSFWLVGEGIEEDVPVSLWAEEKLGLPTSETDALFSGSNTIEDLRVGVKAVLNGESVSQAIQTRRLTENTSGL